jgi:hypothetical protein
MQRNKTSKQGVYYPGITSPKKMASAKQHALASSLILVKIMVANNAWFLETIMLHPFQIPHETSIIMESMVFLILSRLRASFVHHSSTDVSYWPKWLDIYCINYIKLRPPSKFEWWNNNCIVCDLLDLAHDCKKRIFTTILPISTVKTICCPNSILHHQPLKKLAFGGRRGVQDFQTGALREVEMIPPN